METHPIRWKQRTMMLLVIVGAIVAIDLLLGGHIIGATARFAWNGIAFVAQWFARSLEAAAALTLRRRAFRIFTGIFTAIGLMYVSHLFLTDTQVRKAQDWKERGKSVSRILAVYVRDKWHALPFSGKCVFVMCAITAQIALLPGIAAIVVFFPIAFLLPVWRSFTAWLFDTYLGEWYWQKFGKTHRKATTRLHGIPVVREIRGTILLTRLRYLTAWRMWKYEPCYHIARSERRRISLFEPLRLWWHGELDRYLGRPLLNGPKRWPKTTYEPPELWFDRDEPHVHFVRNAIAMCAMFFLAFAVRGSVRRR